MTKETNKERGQARLPHPEIINLLNSFLNLKVTQLRAGASPPSSTLRLCDLLNYLLA
jgi:hypothetical protein